MGEVRGPPGRRLSYPRQRRTCHTTMTQLTVFAESSMDRLTLLRVAVLYLPVCAALLTGRLRRQRPRTFPALLLSLLWVLGSLLVLQRLNQHFKWWSFLETRDA